MLPSVTWVLDAMKADAPLLHDDVVTSSMGKKGNEPSNISTHIHFESGKVDEAFAKADVVIEREFKTASVHQGYIEPHVTTALWNADGHLTMWTSTQGAFTARQQTAELLQLPVSQVTVVPCEIGGGFGGKIAVYLEPVAALLSRKCGRPVKMVMNRDEVFEGTGPTPGSFMRVKLGATKDGKLVAGEAWLAYDAGAFPGGMIGPGCMCVFSCYDIPNARVDGYDVLANKPKTQAYRAPGATQAAFACESVVDELAEKLAIDPIEFRLKNAAKEGTRRVDGPTYPRIGFVETLEAARNSDHWRTPLVGQEPRPRHRQRLLVQHRPEEQRGRQRQPRRHGEPRRRFDRHRRHAHQRRHATGRNAGHRRRGRPAARGRHRRRRLHRRDRRQPRDLRHRAGRLRGRAATSSGKWPSGRPRSGNATPRRSNASTACTSRTASRSPFAN